MIVIIKFVGAIVCVDGVLNLIIAGLIQGAEVEPDLRNVRIKTNGASVSIQGVAILIDFPVENAD